VWFLVNNSQDFLEADQAVAQRADAGERRLQLLGAPIADADVDDAVVIDGEQYTPFTVSFHGVKVDVVAQGTPPDLFDRCVPVVLEGHWVQGAPPIQGYTFPEGANDGWHFAADRILVKHDNDYTEGRLDEAEMTVQNQDCPQP
jgi:cytochrome c-type biogenesis protein CcmE